ncbi:MAG TPA: tetratricopeptide repeat protein, partial [Longimicrobium sp.]
EARQTAEALVAMEPERPSYRALLGEVQMELGDYPAARASFESLYLKRYTVAVAPRAARWEEMRGQVGKARQLLAAARREAVARGDLPREQVAWFHMREGDVELRAGRLEAADAAYRAGLKANPEDHRLLAGLARVESANRRWERALELNERSVARVLDPTILAEMSDVAEAMGNPARAAEYARVAEVAARRQGSTVHRAWSLYLLDHGRSVNEIAVSAAADVRVRPDVYGYDLLAWALYRRGQLAEARVASARALRLATPDPALYFHAGMIERALGNDGEAARLLERALEINPAFHPRHPAEARAVLDSIAGG